MAREAYDVVDYIRGTPQKVADISEYRYDAYTGQLKAERWSDKMMRLATMTADNGMLVEWRCTGPRGLRLAEQLVDRLGLGGIVRVVDASRLVEP